MKIGKIWKSVVVWIELSKCSFYIPGFGTVYMGLEHAARALAKNLADETSAVVKHK